MKVKKAIIIMLTVNEQYKLRLFAAAVLNKITACNGSCIKFAASI